MYMVDVFKHSCYELIGHLVEKLQSNPDLELIPDLLELDENLTVRWGILSYTCKYIPLLLESQPTVYSIWKYPSVCGTYG